MPAQRTCFVISAIGAEGSEIRNRADLVYDFVISEVLSNEPFNFTIERADKIGAPGIITNQIIDRVTNSDLVIADLTGKNPNVFYELALRHITRKPFIHLISDTTDIPFDNAAVRAIPIDVTALRSVAAAKSELAKQVSVAMTPGFVSESPISIAFNLYDMKNSGDREQIAISSLAADVAEIKHALTLSNYAPSSFRELSDLMKSNAPSAKTGIFGRSARSNSTTLEGLQALLDEAAAPTGLGLLAASNNKKN